MNLFNKIWYATLVDYDKNSLIHLTFYFLAPFSLIYKLIIFLNKLLYRFKIKKITHFSVPIIVVGNLTVGGTGKTPLIILLAEYLAQQGYKPGVVSRGYGGKSKQYPLHVYSNTDPTEAGDEPVLIARRTGLPVVVDPHRVRAVQALLQNNICDVILSDDGLQHTALGRDIEIVVIDGERRFGNGWCLPAGPLREPIKRLSKVDFVVTRGKALAGEYEMKLVAGEIYNLLTQHKLKNKNHTFHAIAGIGNPQNFFNQLRAMGLSIIEHPFPDHHVYTSKDLDFGPNAQIIMTEKDAVKCMKLVLTDQYWCLPVAAECDSMPQSLLAKLINTKNK